MDDFISEITVFMTFASAFMAAVCWCLGIFRKLVRPRQDRLCMALVLVSSGSFVGTIICYLAHRPIDAVVLYLEEFLVPIGPVGSVFSQLVIPGWLFGFIMLGGYLGFKLSRRLKLGE